MAFAKRRVSYVIPPALEAVPRLQLPPYNISRLGHTGPLILPLANRASNSEESKPKPGRNPRHRLGISSLALDTSTQLSGRAAPEGILYSGGRDGLIISWDLGVPTKKRKAPDGEQTKRRRNRWEIMTGWADEGIDEDGDEGDEKTQSDGDILGDVTSHKRRKQSISGAIPYESQWETDLAAFKPGQPSQFRQCAQAHTDWVNDIHLCNYNQTVISASSDGTVKAWSPHLTSHLDPVVIGSHSDYVRCLASSREQNWVASGSFDRTVKLWDISRSEQHDPLITLIPPDASAPKSSIYALAADPFGHTIVSGSPERVVRLWDPRTGKRTGKLVGHTDNIRAILISEDSRYLLTGSADASIKLWSLSSQRCLHTFTHHTESVWSLYSSHPSLEIFYSGDRSGLVCKVDVEDRLDITEGECIVLCQDADHTTSASDGINKITAMDDNLLWTASGHSNIKRWHTPQRQSIRALKYLPDAEAERRYETELPRPFRRKDSSEAPSEMGTRPSTGHSLHTPFASPAPFDAWASRRDIETETSLYGIPFESLVRLVSPNEPFAQYAMIKGRDAEVATLYSAASIMSIPRGNTHRSSAIPVPDHNHTSIAPGVRTEDIAYPINTARVDYEERDLAANAVPFCHEPDEIIVGDHGLVRSVILNDRVHALTVDTSGEVAVWDIVRGECRGKFIRDDVSAASHSGSVGSNGDEKERSPRESLEVVRERIEGEAVVSHWATADTKTGVLTIHLTDRCFEAEVYADEVGFANDRRFTDESKLNLGKWVLRNLFIGFLREERDKRSQEENSSPDGVLTPSLGRINGSDAPDLPVDVPKPYSTSSTSAQKTTKITSNNVILSPKIIPALPPTVTPTTRSSPLLTPMIPLQLKDMNAPLPSIPQSPLTEDDSITPISQGVKPSAIDSTLGNTTPTIMNKEIDYFGLRSRQASLPGSSAIPANPAPDDFSGWGSPGKTEPITPSTPGGLMGRLKHFGKSKRPPSDNLSSLVTETTMPSTETSLAPEDVPATSEPDPHKELLQFILSNPLNPPKAIEAPSSPFPLNMPIYISEETPPSFTTIYHGTVASTKYDVQALEDAMPIWLVEYLLMDKIPPQPVFAKVSFVLMPWPTKHPEDQLPELLNTAQSKLTASRNLRVRKLINHVQEKLNKLAPDPEPQPQHKAEDVYEILCNDVLLPLGMSLAAIRQYVWKQPAELVLHYRRIESSVKIQTSDPPP